MLILKYTYLAIKQLVRHLTHGPWWDVKNHIGYILHCTVYSSVVNSLRLVVYLKLLAKEKTIDRDEDGIINSSRFYRRPEAQPSPQTWTEQIAIEDDPHRWT